MRNKAFAPLIEQICMIAVFAIVAAVCIGGFSRADNISRQTQQQDAAVNLAQNVAEQVKAGALRPEEASLLYYNDALQPAEAETAAFTVRLTPETSDPLLGSARITVLRDGEELFSLTVKWQEGTV